jgi:uncharacterized surface protein with fasciclin (FAS1) repeats
MQIKETFAILCTVLVLSACNTSTDQKSNTPKPTADTTKFNPNRTLAREKAKRDQPYSKESAYRYIETSPETNMWAAMVKSSKWAKDAVNGAYTILTPTNDVLKAWNPAKLKVVRDPANQKEIDNLIGNHIILTPITVEKMGDIKEVETISGKKLKVQPGAQNIGGGIYMLNQIFTKQGSVVLMSKIIEN